MDPLGLQSAIDKLQSIEATAEAKIVSDFKDEFVALQASIDASVDHAESEASTLITQAKTDLVEPLLQRIDALQATFSGLLTIISSGLELQFGGTRPQLPPIPGNQGAQ